METMVKKLEHAGFTKEQESLISLYKSVKILAERVEEPANRQRIIVTLCNKFFKTTFRYTTQKLRITYLNEVIDFIVHSVDYFFKKYLYSILIDDKVHVLDSFTGTDTFIVCTLQFFKEQLDKGEITLQTLFTSISNTYLYLNEIVLLMSQSILNRPTMSSLRVINMNCSMG